jgi:hypothetical protein
MILRAVVTGTPRSGTKYVANLLCRLGVKASHELYFNPWFQSIAELKHEVEVSWMAAPFIAELPADTLVVHLVRNPVAAIDSMVATGHFGPNKYAEFLLRHSGTCDPAAAWSSWNRMIERNSSSRPYVRIRLEDWAKLGERYDLDRNHWVDVPPSAQALPQDLIALGREFGYDL